MNCIYCVSLFISAQKQNILWYPFKLLIADRTACVTTWAFKTEKKKIIIGFNF